NVFVFISEHLQRRVDSDLGKAPKCVDRVVERNAIKMHDMSEIPAHDQRASSYRGESDMERIRDCCRRNDSRIEIGLLQFHCRLGRLYRVGYPSNLGE